MGPKPDLAKNIHSWNKAQLDFGKATIRQKKYHLHQSKGWDFQVLVYHGGGPEI